MQTWATPTNDGPLYGQSWLATHFLRHTPEYAVNLEPYLASIRRDPSRPLEIFELTFGKSAQDVGREIRDYYKSNRFSVLSLDLSGRNYNWKYSTRRLNDWEARFYTAYAKRFFIRTGSEHAERRASLIAELTLLHDERPDDIRPQIELAYLHIDQSNDLSAAKPVVSFLAKQAPENPDVLILQGLMTSGAPARSFFDAAQKQDPNNARAYYEYARTYESSTKLPVEAAQAAVTAMDLSASTTEVPLLAGEYLGQIGQLDDARYVLEPLTVWPRDRAIRSRAANLISEMEGAR